MQWFKWWVMVAILSFVVITFRWPSSDHHFSLNLEPYPDGLFYVVPAWNAAHGREMRFSFQELSPIKPSVLPLYSLFLAIGYVIISHPAAFYLVNVLMGIVSLLCLLWTLRSLKVPILSQVLGTLVYLSHGLVYWLPTVPMAENLGLMLMSLGVLSSTKLRQSISGKWIMGASIAGVALLFTKYTFALPGAMLVGYVGWCLLRQRAWKWLGVVVCVCLVAVGLFAVYQVNIGFNPLNVVRNLDQESTVISKTVFYSFSYIQKNIQAYTGILGGQPTHFLWLVTPFTQGILVFLALTGFCLKIWRGQDQSWAWFLTLSFLAQFPVLLIFYVVDSRYLILSIPLIAVGVAVASGEISRHQWLMTGIIGGSLIFFWSQQYHLGKSLIGANWLNRSEAWQYRAVKLVEKHVPAGSTVISVLPPHLFELYAHQPYSILPLSMHQEFMEKKQMVWPDLLNTGDLLSEYERQVSSGSPLYITQAYLSAEAIFQGEWQQLQERFDLELVAEGCDQTCNIYRLTPLVDNHQPEAPHE